jgi:hypothetical protein
LLVALCTILATLKGLQKKILLWNCHFFKLQWLPNRPLLYGASEMIHMQVKALLTYMLTFLLRYMLSYIHTCLITYLYTYLHTYLVTYIIIYLHTYLNTYLFNY